MALFIRLLPKDKRVYMVLLMLCDALLEALSCLVGLYVRFDLRISSIPAEYGHAAMRYLPLYIAGVLLSFVLFRLYSHMWSLAGFREAFRLKPACFPCFFRLPGCQSCRIHIGMPILFDDNQFEASLAN